ncbi:NAD-dependent epimerase [Dasania sp. GY-MA-18]|uniref:NAD-dependent epimerase n=1 Tax=Dasania phycosphaerae TaxID=2950436 RepID=A0A9J6RPM6_9GAMM|nr:MULTISPECIES: NAD-dependent epimerase [Dasania]MCR8924097.1 NAD-dependent epimerase [Dasania sp. GY-MA-18]MCZ0866670.1 NAD-dependent epimerase [Dasania phycosphaerae]MCZ0870255.1 NAD-dependent epimerase [Dasania phycosphaerae]
MIILVTGSAGFIGCETALQLLARGDTVIGVDNVNDYYSTSLKRDRLQRLAGHSNYHHYEFCISDYDQLNAVFKQHAPQRVIHLAAQAGVRYSISNPQAYAVSNLSGFLNILECCRQHQTEHLVYASSSSVYGANTAQPFSTHHGVNHPVSLYAATKKSNELMAHSYSHLYNIPTTGLRFFTVYGPWGRPDMAPMIFARKISAGEPIDVFNYGNHRRDFTYIDDIVEGVIRSCDKLAQANPLWNSDSPDPSSSTAPYRIYNIGCNKPVELMRFIELIEQELGIEAQKNLLPMQQGDVPDTYADVSELINEVGYHPDTSIETGIKSFIAWYKGYYS